MRGSKGALISKLLGQNVGDLLPQYRDFLGDRIPNNIANAPC